jgi:hypothetical protein
MSAYDPIAIAVMGCGSWRPRSHFQKNDFVPLQFDVNALVEESLNLAYHGARAEKQGFKINMKRSLDPAFELSQRRVRTIRYDYLRD